MILHCGLGHSILAVALTPKKMYSAVARFCGCLRRIFLELLPMLLLLSVFVRPDLAIGAATAPQIAQQPLGQTVNSATPVTLQLQASGTAPLAYQWFRNNLILPGETNSTLALTNGSVLNAGSYFVVVTNVAGSITSTVARVRVDE